MTSISTSEFRVEARVRPKFLFKQHLWLFLVVAAIFFASIQLIGILHVASSTEAREMHVAALMSSGESIILPLRNGVVPSKPPLYHWISSSLISIFDFPIAFATRFVSVCSALFILCLMYWQQTRKVNGGSMTVTVAFGSVAVLASFPMFSRLLIDARVDMLFAALFFASYVSSHSYSPLRVNCFWLSVSLAILTKGPLGLLLPLLISGVRSVCLRQWGSFRQFFMPLPMGMLFLIIPLSWYVSALVIGGEEFAWRVAFENLQRFTQGDPGRDTNILVYLKAYFLKLAPWSWLALVFVVFDLVRFSREREIQTRCVSFLCFLVGFGFFSLSSGKRASYLLPLLPLIAIYVSESIFSIEFIERTYKRLSLPLVLFLCSCLLLILWLSIVYLQKFWVDFDIPTTYLVNHQGHVWALVILCFSLSLFSWAKNSYRLLAVAYCSIVLTIYGLGLGMKGQLKDFEGMAEKINSLVPRKQELVLIKERYEEYFDPLQLLLNRKVRIVDPDSRLSTDVWYMTRSTYLDQLQGCNYVQQGRFSTISDTLRGREFRDVVVFTCLGTDSTTETLIAYER